MKKTKKIFSGNLANNSFIILLVIAGILLITIFALWFSRTGRFTPQKAFETDRSADLSGQKITVLTNQPHLRSAEALAMWFNRETGAVVQNVVVNYEETLNYILKDVLGDSPQLDVLMIWYADLGTLAEKNVITDLTDFRNKNREIIRPDDFIPSLYTPYTLYKGRRWALPYDGDTHVLFYRKSLLKKYDLAPPGTWEDYAAISRVITEKEKHNGIYGSVIMAFPAPMLIISGFMNRLGGYGGNLLDQENRPMVNSPEAVAALSIMIENARYALPTPLETDFDISKDAFLSGRVAMAEQWTDVGIMAEDPAQSLIRGDWGVIQIPMGSGAGARHAPALNAGFSLAISKKAPNTDVALSYLLFATRPDITLRLNLINGGIDPTRISVFESEKYRDFAPKISIAARAALHGAAAWPNIPMTPRLLDALSNNLVMALEHRKSARQALDDTQTHWLEILKQGE
ncbi:extracellular solute-binding protein [Desulfococcaceae bacterium HSG8]|nr:extracellular solute-binding protein [Desulfococcaceae bacterium HSG8]